MYTCIHKHELSSTTNSGDQWQHSSDIQWVDMRYPHPWSCITSVVRERCSGWSSDSVSSVCTDSHNRTRTQPTQGSWLTLLTVWAQGILKNSGMTVLVHDWSHVMSVVQVYWLLLHVNYSGYSTSAGMMALASFKMYMQFSKLWQILTCKLMFAFVQWRFTDYGCTSV